MASQIKFKVEFVLVNNMQFARLIDFGIEIADQTATTEERPFVERMKKMRDESFWPGRGIDIAEDFPTIPERKFWSRVFFDASRAIFDRRVGVHEHSFWQAQSIHQAHATALLFESAVRNVEPRRAADTLDRREFDRVVNGIKR
jgi:hypothetical protein